MTPVASKMTEVDNLPGEEVEFSISDARWVMRSMADLYSNRELAVVREYSTNARDAMDEAGKKDEPILVTLPSLMNPYFSVQDYGVGMSEHDLKYVYTAFGDSTKRESNDFNGMLGFGCKSAVAYTNTFTVTSVKDGHKTIAVVTRKEDYSIVLKVIVSVPTTEPNGTKVEVPVNNYAEFERKARDFYRFWPTGTVLINGKTPAWAVGDKIGEGLYYANDAHGVLGKGVGGGGYEDSYVVMGNVPYRINNPGVLFKKVRAVQFVAYVDNGAVEFTPSREDLKYSEHTKATLQRVIDDFERDVVNNAQKEVQGAPNHAEAYKTWTKWRDILGSQVIGELIYKGDKLTETIFIDPEAEEKYQKERALSVYAPYPRPGMLYRPGYGVEGVRNIQMGYMGRGLIITGHPSLNVASSQKNRVKEWAKVKGLDAFYFYFVEVDKIDNPWIPLERVVSWEQVKTDVPPPKRVKRASNIVGWGRKAGTFDLVSKDANRVSEQDVPASKKLYYIMTKEYNDRGGSTIRSILGSFDISEKVVIVPANRLDKFLRNYPHAVKLLDELSSQVKFDGHSMIPDEIQERRSWKYEEHRVLMDLQPVKDKIIDTELVRRIELESVSELEKIADYNKHLMLARALGKGNDFKAWDGYRNKYGREKSPTKIEYPLLSPNMNNRNHAVFYINAVYTARKDGKNVV